jgi:hypothetical protein
MRQHPFSPYSHAGRHLHTDPRPTLNEAHKMNTVRLTIKVPPDVKRWLAERAEHFGGTMGSEVSRCLRASMAADAASKRRDQSETIPAE